METTVNASVSANSVTIKGKMYKKEDISGIQFKEPKSMPMAIFSNLFKYIIAIVFVIGIPLCIIQIYYETKYYRAILTLNDRDKNGKKKEKTLFITKADYDYLRSNY